MPVSSSTSTGSVATAANGTNLNKPTTEPNDRLGKDAFLQLLVAQLKYQNPLSPMDGTEFVAQTAQLTMTEKLTELSKFSEASVMDSNRRTAADLVGKTITYNSGNGVVEGTVTSALMNGGNPVLLIGRVEVPLGAVLEVRAKPAE
jgi:flagellar basal-body rod modification protein FlgD